MILFPVPFTPKWIKKTAVKKILVIYHSRLVCMGKKLWPKSWLCTQGLIYSFFFPYKSPAQKIKCIILFCINRCHHHEDRNKRPKGSCKGVRHCLWPWIYRRMPHGYTGWSCFQQVCVCGSQVGFSERPSQITAKQTSPFTLVFCLLWGTGW